MSVTAEPQAQAIADLLSVNAAAKRCPYIVGTKDYPTAWDRRHADLDALIDRAREAAADAVGSVSTH